MNRKKQVFARLSGEQILLEQGRILYALLYAFSTAGYRVQVFDTFKTCELDKYGELALELAGVEVVEREPEDAGEFLYLYDRNDWWRPRRKWKLAIHVRFDLFSSFRRDKPIVMPFPMHPVHCDSGAVDRIDGLRDTRKAMRIFFSGDIKGYRINRIHVPRPKLSRLDIIEHIKQRLGTDRVLIEDPVELDALASGGDLRDRCVIVDTNKTWIDDRGWLDRLAAADFFIAPQGYLMPMCHNITEAMSVGVIPITNYPEWLSPSLTPGTDCLAFDTLEQLEQQLDAALTMSKAEVARMRSGVLSYYDCHLRSSGFIERIETHPGKTMSVLLYTEDNVARNHKKLKLDSVLLSD